MYMSVRTPILVSVYSISMVPTGTPLLKFFLLVHHRMVTYDLIFIATDLEDFSPASIQWHGTNVNSTTGLHDRSMGCLCLLGLLPYDKFETKQSD